MPIIDAKPVAAGSPIHQGVLFLHIPKTGGTSIEHEFRQMKMFAYENMNLYTPWKDFLKKSKEKKIRCSLQHVTFEESMRIINRLPIRIIGVFTIVRNPYDRLLSEYHYMKNRLLVKDRDCSIWGVSPSWRTECLTDFDTFVTQMYEKYKSDPNTMDNHFLPQIRFLHGLATHPLIQKTKIYLFDEILHGSILLSIQRDFGRDLNWTREDIQNRKHPKSLVHKNKFAPQTKDIPVRLATIRLIQEWFQPDFAFFRFPMAPPPYFQCIE